MKTSALLSILSILSLLLFNFGYSSLSDETEILSPNSELSLTDATDNLSEIYSEKSSSSDKSEQSQIKRKRLIKYYSSEKARTRSCTNTKCEKCFPPRNAAQRSIMPAKKYKNKRLKTCENCYSQCMALQPEERILIQRDRQHPLWDVAKILEIDEENGTFKIEYIEGPICERSKTIVKRHDITKLIHEIIPDDKLCAICGYFAFGKKKCIRCHKEACSECWKVDTGSCFFCRLLHFGTPILLKRDFLDKHTDIILQQNFGPFFMEAYGMIEKCHIMHDQKTYYEILISNDYEWLTNHDGGSSQFRLQLKNPVTLYVSEEEIINILKPPNTFQLEEFDINQFLNDELDELEDGEILIYNHMMNDDDNPWGSSINDQQTDNDIAAMNSWLDNVD